VTLVLLKLLAVLFVIAGVIGTVLPVMPGPFLVLGGLLLYAWTDGFAETGAWTITAISILTLLTAVIDPVATAFGAGRVGASRRAVVGAALGTLAGLFLGLPGLLVGPFVGAALAEYTARRDIAGAGRVGLGVWVGLLLGTAAKLALVFAAIGVFIAAYVL
jgi:uncharacterized protein YqgC (DUF456 family)